MPAGEFVAALQNLSCFADQGPHALLGAERGTFLDPRDRAFGSAAKGREYRRLAVKIHRVVAPFPGRDHPPVQIKDALQFFPREPDLRGPDRVEGKGRNRSAQAVLP